MSKHIDYYKILQVHENAGQEIIDAAYRCLSKIYHPDINKSPMAVEHMKSINIAYSVIGDNRKRREYHTEWLKNTKPKSVSNQRIDNNINHNKDIIDKNEMDQKEIDLAYQVLDQFFQHTVNEQWESAYQKLTLVDKTNVPLEDFFEWKKSVAKLYKLGNYKIKFFRKFYNCDYSGIIYPVIIQFSVTLTEMQIITGQISEDHTQKYVAFDKDGCRICLGYSDLKPIISKFKNIAYSVPKTDTNDIFLNAITKIDPLTGILSYRGFVEQAEREMLRSQRYGNPLSLAVITLKPIDVESFELKELEQSFSYVSEILCDNLRRTDFIGRCNESSFSILFTETKLDEAKEAVNKFLDLARTDEFNYNIYSACTSLNKGNVEKIIKTTLEKVVIKENVKLGKYMFSDIINFNNKGKNHF